MKRSLKELKVYIKIKMFLKHCYNYNNLLPIIVILMYKGISINFLI